MASEQLDGQNKLSKNIREQNLKFSVEFQDGAEGPGGAYEDDFNDDEVMEGDSSTKKQATERKATKTEKTVNQPKGGKSENRQKSPIFKTEPVDSPDQTTHQKDTKAEKKSENAQKHVKNESDRKQNRIEHEPVDQGKGVRTKERLERKRKWNAKPEDTGNASKTEEQVKLPPIQNRWSPHQSTPSTVKGQLFVCFGDL